MKSAEANKKAWSWVVDPIKSFQDGSEGQKNGELRLAERWEKGPIKELILWDHGKRAFDIIATYIDGPITQEAIDVFLEGIPDELVRLWNNYESSLTNAISEGTLEVHPLDSEGPIKEYSPLSIEPDEFWSCHCIEPYFMALDDLCQRINLLEGTDVWPYPRELTAAFFTICNLNSIIAEEVCDELDAEPYTWEAYVWVGYWFAKLSFYDHTKQTVQLRQDFLQVQKSQSMNTRRHSRRNEAMQLVTDDWSQRKSDFRSAERAGIHYADWLEDKGFKYEPRTITTWIREYAKENGIKLR